MAHIVGVPKREPCQKCELPVFLAERVMIGKYVYHRTCLRCARCSSQLTPGSFYETEVDGEYCCETCPDEEKKLNVASTSKDNKGESFNRKSIAERLAFFENDGNKVLQKSLSDEEKSQSLKKFQESQQQTVYKPNTALSSFINNHLCDTVDSASCNASRRSSNGSTSSNASSITDDISEEAPELPKSLPPSSLEVDVSGASSLQPLEVSPESSAIESNASIDVKCEDVHSDSCEIKSQIENTLPDLEGPSLSISEQKKHVSAPICKDVNLSMNVTKDSSEDDEQMRTKRNLDSVDHCKEENSSVGLYSTNRASMVRARLHQFEVIANKSQDSSISSVSKNRLSNFNKTKRRSIDESPKSLETEVPMNISEHDASYHDSLKFSSSTDLSTNNENEDASYIINKNEEIAEKNDKDGYSDVKKELVLDNNNTEEILQINLSNDKSNPSVVVLVDSKEVLSDDLPVSKKDSALNASFTCDEDQASVKEVKPADITDMSLQNNFTKSDEYPEELNPFKSDDENEEKSSKISMSTKEKRKSLNPFESSDEESESEKKLKPPRPPPPKKISTNPFGSESEEEDSSLTNTASSSTPKKTPIPTPRNSRTTSQNPTPEPTPRITRQIYDSPLKNISDYYGSTSSLSTPGSGMKGSIDQFHRESEIRGSGRSLASSSGSGNGTMKPRKKKAPAPPPPVTKVATELFSPSEPESRKSSPGSSTATTPTPQRKKRPAPPPPSSTKIGNYALDVECTVEDTQDAKHGAEIEKLCDEEKALLESSSSSSVKNENTESHNITMADGIENVGTSRRRLIALDASLIEDANDSQDMKVKEEENVVYRRTITPIGLDEPAISPTSEEASESHDRQLEKLKDNKEAKNRNRQSQISLHPEENDPLYNKSIHGKWKRRKGPAPALPVPPKKVLQMLPLQEIRHELEIIEVQQQGLEKQGVMLEKMIRERCEGPPNTEDTADSIPNPPNSKEVEDLILQLFELVNEKNELFRRQAELMYLRRQHRLEQEQADLEYEIRVLMAQPERNKTDSDKTREEALIARLVEVVQLRNEVVECLEMDRLREAEEDMSIKQRLEMHSAKRDEELSKQTPTKLSKKEKKKQKEHKKLGKSRKLDADKDADESELNTEKQKSKKKKKKFLF